MTIIYNYNGITKEFTGTSEINQPPGFGLPSNSTNVKPPKAEKGFVYCWNGKAWRKTQDQRGETVYNKKDGSVFEIKQLGPIPGNYTEIAAPSLNPGETLQWDEKASQWVVNPPSNLFKATQLFEQGVEINARNQIIGVSIPPSIVAYYKQLNAIIRNDDTKGQFFMATTDIGFPQPPEGWADWAESSYMTKRNEHG